LTYIIGAGLNEVLGVCEKAEFACAELYHHFADLFKGDREIFQLWLKVAMEKENRARLFALVGKLRHDNIIASIEMELTEAEVALIHVQSLVENVKEHPPSVLGALEICMELEIKLDRIMSEEVIKFADASYEKSFLAITNSKHLELLQQAYLRLSVPAPEARP